MTFLTLHMNYLCMCNLHCVDLCRLPELLLAPSRRINEYVTLLTWFQMHTAPNHADRSDLQAAIVTFTELNNLSQEVRIAVLVCTVKNIIIHVCCVHKV